MPFALVVAVVGRINPLTAKVTVLPASGVPSWLVNVACKSMGCPLTPTIFDTMMFVLFL